MSRYMRVEFPELRGKPIVSGQNLAGSNGVPIEVSRKGVRLFLDNLSQHDADPVFDSIYQ